MKKFFITTFFFVFIPIFGFALLEIILPPTFFTHRTWEALKFQTLVPRHSYFYPNSRSLMNATGDLCHHTNKSVIKKEFWITDKLGFRNDKFIEQADILFIGDSFIAGSGLGQDELVTNKVNRNLGNKVKVYNMAPSSFSKFDYYLKAGLIKKPKIIIFSIVERNIPAPITFYQNTRKNQIKNSIYKLLEYGGINVIIDRAFKFSSIHWAIARIQNSTGMGIQSKADPTMFFLDGPSRINHTDKDLQAAVHVILSYKKYCESLGITFIFMPLPDKETVYYNLVPLSGQPNYLFKLDSLLNISNVSTLNTLKIFNDYKKTNHKLLYHLDDTHWNQNATELLSGEIIKKLHMIQNEKTKL